MNSNMFAVFSAMNQGNNTRALQLLQDILTEDPENALAHAYLSLCLSGMQRRYGAMQEAERALNLDPELSFAHAVHAVALHNLDDPVNARKATDRALALDPYDTTALELKCALALSRGDLANLRGAAEKLVEKDPNSHLPKYYLSRLAALSGDGRQAEIYAREALAIAPHDAANHQALGWAFVKQNELSSARKAALNSLKIDPTNKDAHLLYAYIRLLKNPFTGIIHRIGLFMRFLSEKKIMIYFPFVLLFLMVTTDFARYLEIPALKYSVWASVVIFSIGLYFSNLYVSRMLEKELATVRLNPDY